MLALKLENYLTPDTELQIYTDRITRR